MVATSSSVGSGAAGAATFSDSDSRRFRYFEPRGQRATHYEDVTVDVQPDPERYLIQSWIINFADGKGAYVKDATEAKSSNWHAFRAPDQEWERTHYQRQSKIETMVQGVIANGRRAGVTKAFDKAWIGVLQNDLGAWKHAEFGLGTSLMQAQRYGYTQMINNATLTNSSYKLRLAQDLTLYLAEIGLDIPRWSDEAGKKTWLDDPIWQGVRTAVESIMGATDYLEQYFAINVVFEPLVGELVRSGFFIPVGAANKEFDDAVRHFGGGSGLRAQPRQHHRPRLPARQRSVLRRRQPRALPALARQARRPRGEGGRTAAAALVEAAFEAALVPGRAIEVARAPWVRS